MSSVPQIFDRALWLVNKQRWGKKNMSTDFSKNDDAADFLLKQAIDELAERLALFNERFARGFVFGAGDALRTALIKPDQITDLTCLPPIGAEETINLAPQSADFICVPIGLHVANDLVGILTQARLALRPDGLFLASLPMGRTLQEMRAAFLAAESERANGVAPHIHPFADLRDLGDLLMRAGFALPIADSELLVVDYKDARRLLTDLRQMGEANILHARARRPLRRDVLNHALEYFSQNGGKASFEIAYLCARAPADNQAKPLARGSTTTPLKDVL